MTQDIQEILCKEKLLRQLIFSGTYSALSLVGTRADDIDNDAAEQLGLADDCTKRELIGAYREQAINEARKQLEEMVVDLSTEDEKGETLDRMVATARKVRVHATSAKAYMKLEGIGRLLTDFGVEKPAETGIPAIHDHLTEIARGAGAS